MEQPNCLAPGLKKLKMKNDPLFTEESLPLNFDPAHSVRLVSFSKSSKAEGGVVSNNRGQAL